MTAEVRPMIEVNGDRIYLLRHLKRWSQGALAEKAGVPQSTISLLESGKKGNTSVEQLARIAMTLGTTVDDLLKVLPGVEAPQLSRGGSVYFDSKGRSIPLEYLEELEAEVRRARERKRDEGREVQ